MNKKNKKQKINQRKLIIAFVLIGIVLFFILVNFTDIVSLKDTFIYSIADKVVKNSVIFFLFLVTVGIIGLSYKNKTAYYTLFFNIELVICYILFLSKSITKNFYFDNGLLNFINSIIFLLSFITTFWFKDTLLNFEKKDCVYKSKCNDTSKDRRHRSDKKEDIALQKNMFEPINEYDQIYNNRHYQADELINIISDNNRCTICVSSKWGNGKTSFINGVLERLTNYESNDLNFEVEEIRINAMELDNVNSLMNYFFIRIKEILKSNGIYVGINSEYQELVASLVGIATNNAIGNFIKSKFSTKSDYRERLSKLSELVKNELIDKKIIVVVDDLERCREDKILDFLYYIKEISVIHRCIIVFLTDYNKLISKKEDSLNEEFLEKFFNYRLNLHTVSIKEIIEMSIQENKNHEKSDFVSLLNHVMFMYESNIKYLNDYGFKNKSFLNKRTPQEKQEDKDKAIAAEEKNYNSFISIIQNPRHLQRIHQKFMFFQSIVDKKVGDKEFDEYIDRIDYKTQLIILSLLFVIEPTEYASIEENGIMNYIDRLPETNDFSSDKLLLSIVLNEWKSSFQFDITQEKLHFIHYLLVSPNELDKSANGMTLLQEKYIKKIDSNEKVFNTSIEKILPELLNAKFKEKSKKIFYIKRAIKLYKDDLNFNNVILFMSKSSVASQIAQEDNIVAFYEALTNMEIINKKSCNEFFIKFAKNFLINKLDNIKQFVHVLFLNFEYNNDNIEIENTFEFENCYKMVNIYIDNLDKYYKMNLNKSGSTVTNLYSIYNMVEEECRKKGISSSSDITYLSEKAKESIKCIEYLLRIENYIYSQNQNAAPNDYRRKLLSIIDGINNSNIRDHTKYYDLCENLLKDMIHHCEDISEIDLENIDEMIEAYFKKYDIPPIELRGMYIKIKEQISKQNTKQYEVFAQADI